MDYSIIKDLLDERNMSFKELSDKLGVDRNNLYNSLTKGNPTLQRLEAVANALNVPVWVCLPLTASLRYMARLSSKMKCI